jgi:pseudouridine kinase
VNTEKRILVIGAAIFDLMGFPHKDLLPQDSVPGKIETACGGVGRNIAENIHRLGLNCQLLAVFGDDMFSRILIGQAKQCDLDISPSLFLNGNGVQHLAIMDGANNMAFGIAGLEVQQQLSPKFLMQKRKVLNDADILVLETNTSQESIDYIFENYGSEKAIFVDPVSAPMAVKIKPYLHLIHTLKANELEVAALFGQALNSTEVIQDAAQYLLEQGIKNVCITLGDQGVYYADQSGSRLLPANRVKVVSTTGAGDAAMAGLVMGYTQGWSLNQSAIFAKTCAELAIQHSLPVHPEISVDTILKLMRENIEDNA